MMLLGAKFVPYHIPPHHLMLLSYELVIDLLNRISTTYILKNCYCIILFHELFCIDFSPIPACSLMRTIIPPIKIFKINICNPFNPDIILLSENNLNIVTHCSPVPKRNISRTKPSINFIITQLIACNIYPSFLQKFWPLHINALDTLVIPWSTNLESTKTWAKYMWMLISTSLSNVS